MPTTLKALVIAQTFNHRTKSTITTFQISMPRFVLAQLNKHRILSSNTESNRAVPIAKKDAKLLANPYFPLSWGTNQKGMQSGVPLQGFKHHLANLIWFLSLHSQRFYANLLNRLGVHKEIVNRLTEPFQLVDVVITGTQWEKGSSWWGCLCDVCFASKKSSEREFFVPARTHLAFKLLTA